MPKENLCLLKYITPSRNLPFILLLRAVVCLRNFNCLVFYTLGNSLFSNCRQLGLKGLQSCLIAIPVSLYLFNTLKYLIIVHVRIINFWVKFHPVWAYIFPPVRLLIFEIFSQHSIKIAFPDEILWTLIKKMLMFMPTCCLKLRISVH